MDLEECRKKYLVKEISKDEEFISSIIKASKYKIKSEKLLPLNNFTTNSKITLAYDCLRELLEALSIKNKLKIYNHECYTPFLKEVIKKSNLADDFDEIRKIRNSINYYGKIITIEECKSILEKIYNLIKSIKIILKEHEPPS